MVAVEKIASLSLDSGFDSSGPAGCIRPIRPPGLEPGCLDTAKVSALGMGTRYDVCASTASARKVTGTDRIGDVTRSGICHSFTHDGRCVSLFKTLYTNACYHNCKYCPNAAGSRSGSRVYSYAPEELAKVTLSLYRGNYIEGLFLSSGTGRDEDLVMEQMVETAGLLRNKHRFRGYIHLKVMPGAARHLIEEAMRHADRVSVNLEAPSSTLMGEISTTKDYLNDIVQRQRYIRDLNEKVPLPAGQTTQLVVGGAGENDAQIFKRVVYEYDVLGVKRSYYSAFTPVKGTEFEARQPEPTWREHRLYQIDWLYRVYRFKAPEIANAFDDYGFLADSDPKAAIARAVLDGPVDPNSSSYRELLRVPGIGPVSARRIVTYRSRSVIGSRRELSNLGVRVKRAMPYLKVNGWIETTLDRWSS